MKGNVLLMWYKERKCLQCVFAARAPTPPAPALHNSDFHRLHKHGSEPAPRGEALPPPPTGGSSSPSPLSAGRQQE